MASEEKRNGGFILLHRSLQDHWVWGNAEYLKWWLDILMQVNFKDASVLIKGQLVICKRGQSIKSLETWAQRWRVDVGRVRHFFGLLVSDQMIGRENLFNKTTRITVCNYDSYNDLKQAENKLKTSLPTPDNILTNTNNKGLIKGNKGNEEPPAPAVVVPITSFKKMTKEEFTESLKTHVTKYGRDILNEFFAYWTEPDDKGKMKFQLQKTWETNRRLVTWKNRKKEFGIKNPAGPTSVPGLSVAEQQGLQILKSVEG
jgi:hypothetical protein